MENATKALMIAGAVLIAILIISVAMMIFGQGNDIINQSSGKINQVEQKSFNTEFEAYADEQKGSTLKQLISTVITSNNTYGESQPEKKITMTYGSTTGDDATKLTAIRSALKAGVTYNVTLGYEAGYVHTITIEDVKTKGNTTK